MERREAPYNMLPQSLLLCLLAGVVCVVELWVLMPKINSIVGSLLQPCFGSDNVSDFIHSVSHEGSHNQFKLHNLRKKTLERLADIQLSAKMYEPV